MITHLYPRSRIEPSYHIPPSTLNFTPTHKTYITIAYRYFILESGFNKIYFGNSGSDAYGKLGERPETCPKLPHSMRKLNATTFVVTANRTKILQYGSFKKIKEAWEVCVEPDHNLHIRSIVVVVDKVGSPLDTLPRQLCDSLDPIPGIESITSYIHCTSKGLLKRFHTAEKALCDLFFLKLFASNLNFAMCMQMALDILDGSARLHARGLLHGDLKSRNLLVYHNSESSHPFSIRQTDLSSLTHFGSPVKEQTEWWLAPEHRMQIIREDRGKDFSANYENFLFGSSKKLIFTHSAAIATVGLVLAEFGLFMRANLIEGPLEYTTIFWQTVRHLTGGFLPKESTIKMAHFHDELNKDITSRTAPSHPSITLEDAIRTLTPLSLPLSPKIISSLEEIPISITCSNIKLSSQISRIVALFRGTIETKVYFGKDGIAYTKRMNKTANSALHSLYKLDSTTFIVIFDRCALTTKLDKNPSSNSWITKCGWLISLTSENSATTHPIAFTKDTFPSKSITRWSVEDLPELTHVETVRRFAYPTSGLLSKQFHISERYLNNLSDYLFFSPLPFSKIVTLSIHILLGLQALHEKDFTHGNLSLKEVLLFRKDSKAPLSAKLRTSIKTAPIGKYAVALKEVKYFPPKVLHEIQTRAPGLHYQDLEEYLKKDPSLQKTVLTKPDEIAMAGFLLADIAFQKGLSFDVSTEPFWKTIENLTGYPCLFPDTSSFEAYRKKIYTSLSLPLPSPISLDEAIARLSGLLPK